MSASFKTSIEGPGQSQSQRPQGLALELLALQPWNITSLFWPVSIVVKSIIRLTLKVTVRVKSEWPRELSWSQLEPSWFPQEGPIPPLARELLVSGTASDPAGEPRSCHPQWHLHEQCHRPPFPDQWGCHQTLQKGELPYLPQMSFPDRPWQYSTVMVRCILGTRDQKGRHWMIQGAEGFTMLSSPNLTSVCVFERLCTQPP